MNYSKNPFEGLPTEVIFLKLSKYTGIPVSATIAEQIVKKYPKHFPEEHDRISKWESIPKEVHDKYWEESNLLEEDLKRALPINRGLLYYLEHPEDIEEQKAWNDVWNSQREQREQISKTLHNKYYKPYGITYTPLFLM